jgi:succinate dehydrogenase / fumarate reductase, cytochrome b subunit
LQFFSCCGLAAKTKELILNSLINALSSSVGRKYVMALTGLFLCLFLVIHLAGNLLLYVGADAYNAYAIALHEQQAFLIVSEVLLYTAFVLHVYIALKLTGTNLTARRDNYARKQSKRTDRTIAGFLAPEVWMFWTGAIVLAFTLVHVADFKFELGFGADIAGYQPYDKAGVILKNSWRAGLYVAGSVMLGLHVAHGFQSAFQSLGLNHPRINSFIRWFSVLFGWAVAIGFGSFPVVWYCFGGPT